MYSYSKMSSVRTINILISAFMLGMVCIPRNISAFHDICRVLRVIELFGIAWAVLIFVEKKYYRIKWIWPLLGLLVVIIICTLAVDPEDFKDAFILVYRLFTVTILTESLFRINPKSAVSLISKIWFSLMVIQTYSLISHCFGTVVSSNGVENNNYFFGIRVEINEYIIYAFAFCCFAGAIGAFRDKVLAVITIVCGTIFAFIENVSTSLIGCLIFGVTLIITLIIKSEKALRNGMIFFTLMIICFIFVRNTQIFEWILVKMLNEDLTLNGRTELWRQAIEQMKGHWIFGYGFSPQYNLTLNGGYAVNHPHNQYLQILYDYGIFGLLLYLQMIKNMIMMIPNILNSKIRTIFIASLAATLVMCISSRNFFYMAAQIYYVMVFHLNDLDININSNRNLINTKRKF